MRHNVGGISIDLPPPWADFTEETSRDVGQQAPYTFNRPDVPGGALQLSTAIYVRGPQPSFTREQLAAMAHEGGQGHGLGAPLSEETFSAGPLTWVRLSFHHLGGDMFVQVLYGSDGQNVVKGTYVCDWSLRGTEDADVEHMVQSIRFDAPRAQAA